MEYTKDVIINVKYNKKTRLLNSKFNKLIAMMQRDNYFISTMLVSILVLSMDFLIVKRFVEIINLL